MLAVVPLICTAFNVATPYKAYDDVLHRSLARWVAARTRPGDQWVVFDGASPLPLVKDLMVMPWLQRVAEARFYLLKYSPVPLRWEPDPQTIARTGDGRIWLIIQNHGDRASFRRNAWPPISAPATSLGRPRTTACFTLPRNESWSIREYRPRWTHKQSSVTSVSAGCVGPARGDISASFSGSRSGRTASGPQRRGRARRRKTSARA